MDTNVNREHKNSVFSSLFSTPDVLRELYSAIEGIDIPPDTIVDINTLSEVLFLDKINDVSFTIDDQIVVLIEHQSTISNNVPTRLLMYIGRVYEKILDGVKFYKKKLVELPLPEFIVLYNGKDEYPDYQLLRLSTAFKKPKGILKARKNTILPLELAVHIYNINHGRNREILEKSKTLGEYSIFIKKINEYKTDFSLEESVKVAVNYCIENNILKKFLQEHASEVINMLLQEPTIEEIIEVRVAEAVEEALEKAVAEAVAEAIEKAQAKARKEIFNLLSQGLSIEETKQRLNAEHKSK